MILFSAHAEAALARRRLRRAWIESAILEPDRTEPDAGAPEVTRSFKTIPDFGARVLRVVHRPDGHDILVITAFFDRGARP
ncbi:DUF4258 domain-containing protein [Roseospira visakhapatnamensis]|uniref:DUF4258 domain-containing protein n=1 Tax=Roseospira visakhapatnamensis TaxID=390880 RepID=A0A7W6RE76_9PROT|nr:DUF4258 domain-containing protein [Roseospira visakhapatnamensis]MBB4266293.1 hypothetical protein [Roseospira visakhapatnamensis]